MEAALPAVFLLGFVSGFKHAFEPDHVLAISTLLHREPRVGRGMRAGVAWGIGHTTMLMAGVAVVAAFRVRITPDHLALFEMPVAAMLLILGGWAVWTSVRRVRSLHRHTHDGIPHLHVGEHPHPHDLPRGRSTWQAFSVGLVHGLAGSGALLLLVAASLPSFGLSMTYAVIFGIGSVLGMIAVSGALACSFLASRSRPVLYNVLTGLSGVLSVFLALWIVQDVLR